jgi:hypothetical protein
MHPTSPANLAHNMKSGKNGNFIPHQRTPLTQRRDATSVRGHPCIVAADTRAQFANIGKIGMFTYHRTHTCAKIGRIGRNTSHTSALSTLPQITVGARQASPSLLASPSRTYANCRPPTENLQCGKIGNTQPLPRTSVHAPSTPALQCRDPRAHGSRASKTRQKRQHAHPISSPHFPIAARMAIHNPFAEDHPPLLSASSAYSAVK